MGGRITAESVNPLTDSDEVLKNVNKATNVVRSYVAGFQSFFYSLGTSACETLSRDLSGSAHVPKCFVQKTSSWMCAVGN